VVAVSVNVAPPSPPSGAVIGAATAGTVGGAVLVAAAVYVYLQRKRSSPTPAVANKLVVVDFLDSFASPSPSGKVLGMEDGDEQEITSLATPETTRREGLEAIILNSPTGDGDPPETTRREGLRAIILSSPSPDDELQEANSPDSATYAEELSSSELPEAQVQPTGDIESGGGDDSVDQLATQDAAPDGVGECVSADVGRVGQLAHWLSLVAQLESKPDNAEAADSDTVASTT